MKTIENLPLVLPNQISLFGEPERNTGLSQWFTPAWIADRMAALVHRQATVIEPSAGGGALIEALLRRGHPPELITAIDLDPRWVSVLRDKCPGINVLRPQSFLEFKTNQRWDFCLQNPPYEDALHAAFVSHALGLAREVIALVPSSIEFGGDRDRELWAKRGRVEWRARLPNRVKFGGDNQASFDSVVLRVVPRKKARPVGEVVCVAEEVWS